MRVRVRRVVLPKPELKPPRKRWEVSRLLLAFIVAILIHGAMWLFFPKHKPAPTGSKGVIEVQMREKGPTRQSPVKSQVAQKQQPTHPQKAHPKAAPQNPDEEQKAYEPTPSDQSSSSSTPPMVSGGGHSGASPQTANPGQGTTAPGHVRLFDPNALGNTVQRWSDSQPSREQFMAPESQGDGNSPEQEKARVNSRLAGQFARAEADGRVAGGLVSSCNDGVDQGMDGLMDCADPGCRLLPACANTKEFKNYEAKEILDDDVRGVTSTVEVTDDDDEKIRALSLQVNLVHSSPGDLELEIDHNGKKEVLRLANRSEHFFDKAFLAADFIGQEAQGKWTLRIRDVVRGTSGTLRGWTLFVTR